VVWGGGTWFPQLTDLGIPLVLLRASDHTQSLPDLPMGTILGSQASQISSQQSIAESWWVGVADQTLPTLPKLAV
jgi:hypothetical protein